MKCLHCGYCCMMMDVIIVSPEYATEDFEMGVNVKLGGGVEHKPTGVACPHLEMEGDKYYCKVHEMPWFKGTPCDQYGQIESSVDNPCRTGDYIKSGKGDILKEMLNEIYKETTIHA